MIIENRKVRDAIDTATKEAKSYEEFVEAIRDMIAKYGLNAIYYINCDRYRKDGDKNVVAVPYERYEDGKRLNLGFSVVHHYYDSEEERWCSYSGELIIFL